MPTCQSADHQLEAALLLYATNGMQLALATAYNSENLNDWTELNGGGYSRQTIPFGNVYIVDATHSAIKSINDIQFGPATSEWDGIVAYVFVGQNGNFYDVVPAFNVLVGQPLILKSGSVVVEMG